MTKNEMIEQTWRSWNCCDGDAAMVCGHLFIQFTGTFPYDFKTLEDLQTWLNGD